MGQSPQDARPEHRVRFAGQDGAHHVGKFLRIELIIAVEEHHHVGPEFQRLVIEDLLISAHVLVLGMPDGFHAVQLPGDLERLVMAAVVADDDLVHPILGDVVVGRPDGLLRVIRDDDGDNFLVGDAHAHEVLPGLKFRISPVTRATSASVISGNSGNVRIRWKTASATGRVTLWP